MRGIQGGWVGSEGEVTVELPWVERDWPVLPTKERLLAVRRGDKVSLIFTHRDESHCCMEVREVTVVYRECGNFWDGRLGDRPHSQIVGWEDLHRCLKLRKLLEEHKGQVVMFHPLAVLAIVNKRMGG